MFTEITLLDYSRPLAARLESRKHCGPYRWKPSKPGSGRGFYQAEKGLDVDPRGSTFRLRLELANDHIPRGSRLRFVDGYYCNEFGGDTLQPIIARLPHGRGFLAGYTMGNNMIAALDAHIWETIEEAARAAHGEAESAAEREREYEASLCRECFEPRDDCTCNHEAETEEE